MLNEDDLKVGPRVCLITGGGRGIGLNIARSLGQEGYLLALSDIDSERLRRVKQELEAEGYIAEVFAADISLPGEPYRLVQSVIKKFGKLDILVNNARAGKRNSFLDESEENWDLAFDVNLRAAFFLAQAAVPFMSNGSCIITISSVSGYLVSHESPSYQISKAGLMHLNRYLAVYCGPKGIRANAILPGFIVQDEHRAQYQGAEIKQKKYKAVVDALHPLNGGAGYSNDVAEAVVFLASKKAKFITGQSIVVDGGLTSQDPTKVLFSYVLE
jgi:NAD(P)-dependent dehydrogenase (short-subunit alcohol dehydrogenase family)